jgi:hypothetical protein
VGPAAARCDASDPVPDLQEQIDRRRRRLPPIGHNLPTYDLEGQPRLGHEVITLSADDTT